MSNTRLAVAIHAMTVVALTEMKYRNMVPTSELIAKSVGTNPVVVRRILGMLKRAGLVDARAGIAGFRLTRAPADITLLAIYEAVSAADAEVLFDVHKNPSQLCPVGAHIHEALDDPLSQVQKAMEDKLGAYTLMDVIASIAQKNHLRAR